MPTTQNREIQGQWERTLLMERAAINQEDRTVEIALSSEDPCERWYGTEILGHGPGEVDLSRLLNKAALLCDHNARDQVGVVESARLDSDRKVRCLVRFGRSARAQEVFQDVCDGIRSKISVGYMTTDDYDITKGTNGAPDVYRFKNWIPYEASIVAIPADDTVGVGRSAEPVEAPLSTTPPAAPAGTAKEVPMDPITEAAAHQAAEEQRATELRTERVQAMQLQAIAERMALGQEAREILASDKNLAEARDLILALVAERGGKPMPAASMSEKEARDYSYARAILNSTLRAEGVSIGHCFEDEVSETIAKSMPKNWERKGGILVPLQLRTGLDTATATGGAELKFTQYGGELIELLRNNTVAIQMGARVMAGLNGPVTFPKMTGDATVSFVAENPGSDMAVSAPAFSSVSLAAKIMQGAVPFSRSLLTQSVVSIEAIVRESLANGHALAIDKNAIHGSGSSNLPTGIYRTTGVNTKAMGGVPSYALLQDMITEVDKDNALMNTLGWITSPGMAGKLAQTLESATAGAKYVWTGTRRDGQICGYKAVSSNQVSAVMSTLVDTGGAQHGIVFGNWADLLIGFWGALELVVDPYTLKKQGMIEVASYQMGDVAIRHPESFCVATGATLS